MTDLCAFEDAESAISNCFGSNSYMFLKFLFAYYLASKYNFAITKANLSKSTANELGERIKTIYLENGYEHYRFEDIEDIVKEFNLPHSGINNLEEE